MTIDPELKKSLWLYCYGCVKCQKYHWEDEPVTYNAHLCFQSKHGIALSEKVVTEAQK